MNAAVMILADRENEVAEFFGWLRRNRCHVLGMSDNTGCGCCVLAFDIVVDECAEPIPFSGRGNFTAERVLYGLERDELLAEWLD